jgi:carnitine monooxygenase subunit
MNVINKVIDAGSKVLRDRRGLPGWTYHSQALLELEKAELFRTHWQIAGHISDIPRPGDYITFDVTSERALIVRGEDGAVRAFHNLCRHRGSRVVAEKTGHCRNALVCPFHGWVYNLDGSLRGPARPNSFGSMDRSAFGLKPIELEIWNGFLFVRFSPGPQPPVSKLMAHFNDELSTYDMENLVPTRGAWTGNCPVNWKSVRDVDNEGYHVAMAHPALQDLYGANYHDEGYQDGTARSLGYYNPHAGRRWSVRHYTKVSAANSSLPEGQRKLWGYYGLFPNAVIAVTPELVQFYQEFPLTVDSSVLRGAIYRRPQENREQRLARYLATRIDRETGKEDVQLSIWSNESMKSAAFEGFYLSDLEVAVRSHHDHLRRLLPVMTLDKAPLEAAVSEVNASMRNA